VSGTIEHVRVGVKREHRAQPASPELPRSASDASPTAARVGAYGQPARRSWPPCSTGSTARSKGSPARPESQLVWWVPSSPIPNRCDPQRSSRSGCVPLRGRAHSAGVAPPHPAK
jgi:hypothetical protein